MGGSETRVVMMLWDFSVERIHYYEESETRDDALV